MTRSHKPLLEALQASHSVCLLCHVNPDGDTIGSALALRLALMAAGRRVEVFCQDKVPDVFLPLPGADSVRGFDSLGEGERFDLLLPVDVSEAHRAGRIGDALAFDTLSAHCKGTAQVDHHGTNPGYCAVNDVDGTAPAAGLLVKELIAQLGVPLDAELAACLYAAIATDTGNYSHGNTNAECFRATADLLEAGLDLPTWNRRLFQECAFAQQLLLGEALSSLRLRANGQLAVMTLSRNDFARAGALKEHADTVVNQGLRIRGARMALLAREDETGIKMSLRAIAPDRVDTVAARFGGGGHAQASGCTLQGELAACCDEVARAMEEALL